MHREAAMLGDLVEMPSDERKQIVGGLMDLLQKEDFRGAKILLESWGRRIHPSEVSIDRQND